MYPKETEEVIIKKLFKAGLTGEMRRFSVNKALVHVVVRKKKVITVYRDSIVPEPTKRLFIRRLREKGLIEANYKSKWRPKLRFTEEGLKIAKEIMEKYDEKA